MYSSVTGFGGSVIHDEGVQDTKTTGRSPLTRCPSATDRYSPDKLGVFRPSEDKIDDGMLSFDGRGNCCVVNIFEFFF
jgi:hypothetical protein